MTYLAAALFFALALLAALVALHVTVRLHWPEILLALRGEGSVRRPERRAAPAGAMRRGAAV